MFASLLRPYVRGRAIGATRLGCRTAWLLVWLGTAACTPGVPAGELTPAARRATNEAQAADLQVLEEWGARLRAVAAPNNVPSDSLPQRRRALAMAAAWLAFARDELVREPRSPVVDEALLQARYIIEAGEQGLPFPTESRLILGTRRVRNDLWEQVDRLSRLEGHDPAVLGEASVLLVRAGRVSIPGDSTVCDPAPFLARAEQLVHEMVAALPADKMGVVLAGGPMPGGLRVERPRREVVVRSIYFALNKDSLSLGGQRVLDQLITSLEGRGGVTVELQGYTDPRGSAAYNLDLSRRRALSVQQYLAARTLAFTRFDIRPVGRARATAAGSNRTQLARDRRVDLRVILADGTEAQRAQELEQDLQLEQERRDGVRPRRAGARPPRQRSATRP